MKTAFVLSALAAITSAHFNLDYPAARGFDEDTLGNFPCGGQDTVSQNRTAFPLTGGEIALTMGHIDANVEVLIAYGNSPGSAFNTILRSTFSEQGLGAFCMTGFTIPSSMDGMNATIQVVTNGDPDGGLYNCADVTLSSTASGPATGVCKNATGVTTTVATVTGNPNGTTSSNSTSTTKNAGSVAGVGMGSFGVVIGAVLFALFL